MLFEIATKTMKYLSEKIRLIRKFALLVAPIFLKLHINDFKSMSFESLIAHFSFNPNIELGSEPCPFELKSPNQTIFIKLEGSEDFEFRIQEYLSKMKIRSKSIVISRNDSNHHYFIKIFIKESSTNHLVIYPLMNHQPNSELMYIARSLFESKLKYRVSDLLYNRFENSLEISLENNYSSVLKFCKLIRYFSNLYSHSYGIYYYLPTYSGLIKAESLMIFIGFISLILLTKSSINFNIFITFLNCVIYMLMPFTCVLFANSEFKGIYLILFSIINLKFGFIFAIICYTLELTKEIRQFHKNNWRIHF